MRAPPLIASLLLVIPACGSDVTNPPIAPVVTFSATSAWSGDTIALRSASFAGSDTLPIVMVGADTLQVLYSGDSVMALLPDTNGVVALTIRLHDGSDTSADIHVYGFANGYAGPQAPSGWWGIPWASRGPTTEIGILNGRLQSIDWASGAAVQLSADTGLDPGPSGPAPSMTDTSVVSVTRPHTGKWIAVPFHGATAQPDTGPEGAWAIQLRRGFWVVNGGMVNGSGGSLYSAIKVGTSFVTGTEYAGCGKPKSVAFSPNRNRVVFESCEWGDSEAVFDSSGALAYRIPYPTGGVAFTPGGDSLFLSSRYDTLSVKTPGLFVIDAVAGSVLQHVAAPGGPNYTGSVALDPAHPWLYLLGFDGDAGEDEILVYDRSTLRLLATLRAGHSFHPYAPDMYVDPAGRRLFVVAKNNGDVTVFDLKP